jgi:hypothetical protein
MLDEKVSKTKAIEESQIFFFNCYIAATTKINLSLDYDEVSRMYF